MNLMISHNKEVWEKDNNIKLIVEKGKNEKYYSDIPIKEVWDQKKGGNEFGKR
jgi:hypothetical protein